MRRIRPFVFLAWALLLLGCQGLSLGNDSGSSARPDRLTRILESRELRVGLTGSQPPLNMKNRSGEIIGLEVELARTLARSMGLGIRFVERPFAELLDALDADEVDLVISGMTITPERNARVAFAGPYMVSGKSLLTRSQVLADAVSIADLDGADRSYAALAGSTSQDLVESAFPNARLEATQDYDTAVEMVKRGDVDALIADFPICVLSIMRYPEEGLLTLATPFTVEPLGIALPADSPLFVNLVENYLETLESTGMLVGLKARWFSRGAWIDELP